MFFEGGIEYIELEEKHLEGFYKYLKEKKIQIDP
jgi:hypothetical protein